MLIWWVCSVGRANNQQSMYKCKKVKCQKGPVSLSHQRYSIQIFIKALFICSCDPLDITSIMLCLVSILSSARIFKDCKDTSCALLFFALLSLRDLLWIYRVTRMTSVLNMLETHSNYSWISLITYDVMA